MDRTDYQILNILQKDCRTTLKHIGDQVGLTAPAVSERVRRMEEKGVIRGFRIDVERERLDCSMTGFIFVAVEPEKYNTFCEFCEKSSASLKISGGFYSQASLLRQPCQGYVAIHRLLFHAPLGKSFISVLNYMKSWGDENLQDK